MIYCASKMKVEKIISLNKCNFGAIQILLDRWIYSAGRTNVSIRDDVVWVTVRGIPLHLRSFDLFRQLGSACGTFLDFENCVGLSSISV
ncbi:hypothetical protein LINPERHAP2_LOCUS8504 [Linum perenne]